jgi:uncharacterized membrane protein YhaH (DUF805 family)
MTHYFNFKGVAKRQEYWAVILILFAVTFVASAVLQGLMFTGVTGLYLGVIGIIALVIAGIWAQFATGARRCRDAGISPWWVLLFLLPYVNFVFMIVIGCLKTNQEQSEENV